MSMASDHEEPQAPAPAPAAPDAPIEGSEAGRSADPDLSSDAGSDAQTAPAMDMHPTTTSEKVDGIVAQTRADHAGSDPKRLADVLRQRLAEAGIAVTDDEVQRLVAG